MPGLLDNCEQLFGTRDLYGVIEANRTATVGQLKKAYYKLSLSVHPDRVEPNSKEEATAKFQVLGQVYAILSDDEKRKIYDESGEIDEENSIDPDRDWADYWRLLFVKVTVQNIKTFEKKYKGSDEEENDLFAAYMDSKGDMDVIMNTILCATVDDEPRFKELIEKSIKDKKLPKYKKFTQTLRGAAARKRKAEAEAEELAEDMAMDESENSLIAMIQGKQKSRQQNADDFFSHLEEKYSKPKGKGKKK